MPTEDAAKMKMDCLARTRPVMLAMLSLALMGMSPARASEGIYGYTDDTGVTHLSNVSADGPYRLVLRNPENYRLKPRPEYRMGAPVAEPVVPELPFAEEVNASARAFGLEPALLHAVIKVESNYNPAALSPKGAIGLMQLMPGTSVRFGVIDPWRPTDNIRAGARYLSLLLARFDQDLKLALAAYNAGEETVLRYGRRVPPYRETRDYVARVTSLYQQHVPPAHPSPAPRRLYSGHSS